MALITMKYISSQKERYSEGMATIFFSGRDLILIIPSLGGEALLKKNGFWKLEHGTK
jgi:hypothetical protein